MNKPNIIIQIDGEDPSTHSMTPEQWKRFKQLYKKAGDDCWCDELRELAENTTLKPRFFVSAYENDITSVN